MMILTGGPGTGKTTVVKALIQIYRTLYPEDVISLVAPTGRAAKRLSELTGLDACTIHRELKWDLHKNSFAMNRNNPLSSQVLIIDEFSMVDSLLLSKLFDANRRVHKVLFIGDYHQFIKVFYCRNQCFKFGFIVNQKIFNPKNHQEEYRIGQKVYREGDKILQLKNRPDDDIYNGDIGVLVEINRKDGFEYLEDTLIVDYDGNLVEYTSKDFMTFTLAYCMSIHKAQGNEFKIVIMPVLNDYYIMLKRNLIYTGLTRAKQALFILGNPQAFLYGIKNISDSKRKTTLVNKINQNKNVETYEESSYNQELKQNITDFLNDDETV